jgi:hypothetical protein
MTPGEKKIELDAILHDLNEEEQAVVINIALKVGRRVLLGRQQYGALNLATDRRNWRDEIEAELLDGNIYVEFEALKAERMGGRR